MNTEVKLLPYIARFAIAYLIALVVVAIIMETLNINGGSGSSIASLIAAVSYSVSTFVKEQKRIPTPHERKWLTLLSLVASVLVSLILITAFLGFVGQLNLLIPDLVYQLGIGMMFGIILFVLGLYSLVLWFLYGSFAKIQFKSMEKRGGGGSKIFVRYLGSV